MTHLRPLFQSNTRPLLKDVLQVGDLLVDGTQKVKWFILELGPRDAAVWIFDGVTGKEFKTIIGIKGRMSEDEELWRDGEVVVETSYRLK